uniref:Ankyrin repeat protein n=1 Tax=Marseillevirus LCMAC102 TaxID=2506603 RepID=A0A481YSG6_9VIRU|nr:MAG: ankyrin repeat protein [Marseillevirus LCMAC102]
MTKRRFALDDMDLLPEFWPYALKKHHCNDIELLKRIAASPNNESLNIACEWGNYEIVKHLLHFSNVDPSANDNECLGIATKHGYLNIVKLLLDRVKPEVQNYIRIIREALQNGYSDYPNLLMKHMNIVNMGTASYPILYISPNSSRLRIYPASETVVGFDQDAEIICDKLYETIYNKQERTIVVITPKDGIPCGTGKTLFATMISHKYYKKTGTIQIKIDMKGSTENPLSDKEAKLIFFSVFSIYDIPDDDIDNVYEQVLNNVLVNGLLLLDDVKDLDQIETLIPNKITPCCVIITSRHDINMYDYSVNLGMLSTHQSIELLNMDGQDIKTLLNMASKLGNIPGLLVRMRTKHRSMPIEAKFLAMSTDIQSFFQHSYDLLSVQEKKCMCAVSLNFIEPFTVDEFKKQFLPLTLNLHDLIYNNFLTYDHNFINIHPIMRLFIKSKIKINLPFLNAITSVLR